MSSKPSKPKSPKPKPEKKHAIIGSFGGGTVLWGDGLSVRVEMFKDDIGRILEAIEEYFSFAEDEKAVEAAKNLAEKVGRQTTKLRISMDVVIAAHGAKLDPISCVHRGKKTWETPSGEIVPKQCEHGMRWEE